MTETINDVEKFRLWATSLGCPQDAIPDEEALKSVFKSRQREFFTTLINRVRPRQEVETLRRHILIKEVNKFGNDLEMISAPRRKFLPQQLQTFLTIKDLKKEFLENKTHLEEYIKENDEHRAAVKAKNIQLINVKHRAETLEAKVNILELKSESLNTEIKKEEEHKCHLLKNMPVKLSESNSSETATHEAIQKAIIELENFYTFCSNNTNPNTLKCAKEELWSKLRNIFNDVPSFLLFDAIMHLKDQQLNDMKDLRKANMNNSNLGLAKKEPLTTFDKKLMKLKIDLLALVARYKQAVKKRKNIEEAFNNRYSLFVDEFQKKVREFNKHENEEHVDEVISNYLVKYFLYTFKNSQHDCIRQQIEKCHQGIEQRVKQIENHEILLGTVKKAYSDINTAINNVNYDMMQLYETKKRIIQTQKLLKYKLRELQSSTASHGNETHNNKTMAAGSTLFVNNSSCNGDSFELGADDVLCSTKLNFSTTMSFNNSTTMIGRSFIAGDGKLTNTETCSYLPPHSFELSTFMEMPLEKFNWLNRKCAYYFTSNPLVIDSHELSSTLQLAPGTLLTHHGALQEVRNRISWADLIAKQSNDLKLDLDINKVDIHSYKELSSSKYECLTKLLDEIDVISINTNRTLQTGMKLYNFTLKNPLRHYIPSTILFNNHTYEEYEVEFKTYYRMIAGGNSNNL